MCHRILTLLVSVSLLLSGIARAEWLATGNVFYDRDDVAEDIRTAPDGAGGFVVVWFDSDLDIRGQRVDADGNRLWGNDGVVLAAAQPSSSLRDIGNLVYDPVEGGLFAFKDRGDTEQIYAQRFSPSGVPAWAATGAVVSTFDGTQSRAQIARRPAGGAFVTWEAIPGADFNVYAQRLGAGGNRLWGSNGVGIATSPDREAEVTVIGLASGGAAVAWVQPGPFPGNTGALYLRIYDDDANVISLQDVLLSGTTEIAVLPRFLPSAVPDEYFIAWRETATDGDSFEVARYDASGAAVWSPRSIGLSSFGAQITTAAIEVDPARDELVAAWTETDEGGAVPTTTVFAERIASDGRLLYGAGNAVALTDALENVTLASAFVADDGDGGLITVWRDFVSGQKLAQRLDSFGRPLWDSGGNVLGAPIQQKSIRALIPTPDDGARVIYDFVSEMTRLELANGALARPEPVLDRLADVAGDQGGVLLAEWRPSQLDEVPVRDIRFYSVWRARNAVARASLVDASSIVEGFEGRALRRAAHADFFWEYVGQVDAFARPGYSFAVPTLSDSTSVDDALTQVQILAHDAQARVFESNVLAARSTDDLAPGAPLNLVAERDPAGVTLEWTEPGDPDVGTYRVYRAIGSTVAIEPANLLTTIDQTTLRDEDALDSIAYAYRVVAVDVNENAGAASNLATTAGATSVGPTPTIAHARLRGTHPNPFNPRTTIEFELPRAQSVSIDVFDTRGRRVVRLVETTMASGLHSIAWSGDASDGQPVASGAYFVVLRSGADRDVTKVVLAK